MSVTPVRHRARPPGLVILASVGVGISIGAVLHPGGEALSAAAGVLVVCVALRLAWRMTVQAHRILAESSRLLTEMAQIQAGTAQVQAEADERLSELDAYRRMRRLGR